MITCKQTGSLKPKLIFSLLSKDFTCDPTSYNEAVKFQHWYRAMSVEFDAFKQQNTWVLISIPNNKNILRCKWLFKTKYNIDASIARHKARLVAQGQK